MKRFTLFAIAMAALIPIAAAAQEQCTTYANGQVICVPVGGGQSSYR